MKKSFLIPHLLLLVSGCLIGISAHAQGTARAAQLPGSPTSPGLANAGVGSANGSKAGNNAGNSASSKDVAKDEALGCLIEAQRVADVGAPGYGVVEEVLVERGQAVRKGQSLVTLRSDVERANVDSARQRAGGEAEVAAAEATRDVAKIKMRRTQELMKLGFAAQLELDQARGEYEVADQRLAQARESQVIAGRELKSAEAQLRQRTVKAPFDGVIVDRLTQPGERADGKPLLRLAMLNPLKVEVIVPSSLYGQLKEGQSVSVQPEFSGAELMSAQVQQIDRMIDAASGTFRVRMSLPNPKREIPAGVRCKAQVAAR